MKLIKFFLSFLFIFNFLYINGIPTYKMNIDFSGKDYSGWPNDISSDAKGRLDDICQKQIDRNYLNNQDYLILPDEYVDQILKYQQGLEEQEMILKFNEQCAKDRKAEALEDEARRLDGQKLAKLLDQQVSEIERKYSYKNSESKEEKKRNWSRRCAISADRGDKFYYYIIREHNYNLERSSKDLLNLFDINAQKFLFCKGSEIQQCIHTECIHVINQATEIDNGTGIPETVVKCADLAIDLNNKKELIKAFSLTEFCYNILDIGKLFINACIDSFMLVGRESQGSILQLPILFNDFSEEYLGEYIPTIKDLRITYLDKESYDELILKLQSAITKSREAIKSIFPWAPKQMQQAMDAIWVKELQDNFQKLDLKELGAAGLAWLSCNALEASYASRELAIESHGAATFSSSVEEIGVLEGVAVVALVGSVTLLAFSKYSDNFKNNFDRNYLTSQQMNEFKKKVLMGEDLRFNNKDEAIDFIKKKFPRFQEELAGNRSAEGWHFDSHPINGGSTVIDHINLYSKKLNFRAHIFWD